MKHYLITLNQNLVSQGDRKVILYFAQLRQSRTFRKRCNFSDMQLHTSPFEKPRP
jgi:hypothetical protein